MPNMADIIIKKADGTTDITYTALAPAGGDNTPATWRCESIGTVAGNRPVLTVTSKGSRDRLARIVDMKLMYPEVFTDSTTGIVSVRLREAFSFNGIVRVDALDATTNEATAQAGNLFKSALIQSVFKTGFAPQ